MVSEQAKSEFVERLGRLPEINNVAQVRVRDQTGNTVSVAPNLPRKSGSVRVISYLARDGRMDQAVLREGLEIFGEEFVSEQRERGNHPNIGILLDAIENNQYLTVETSRTSESDVLAAIQSGEATLAQKIDGMVLMANGEIRGAEKIYRVNQRTGIWQPQQHAFDIVKKGLFTAFGMGRTPDGNYDKIPNWDQDHTQFQENGVNADRTELSEILGRKVRLMAPARFTSYLGPGTTVMHTAGLVNVGFYAEGEDTMLEGRCASMAQVGRRVKLGGGSGLVGVLSPDGAMPTILEDDVSVYAMCEAQGLIEKGSVLGSGTVMGDGKKIYDSATGEFLPHKTIVSSDGTELSFPFIPEDRVAVPGTVIPNGAKALSDKGRGDAGYQRFTEAIILLEKPASEVPLAQIPKNTVLYQK